MSVDLRDLLAAFRRDSLDRVREAKRRQFFESRSQRRKRKSARARRRTGVFARRWVLVVRPVPNNSQEARSPQRPSTPPTFTDRRPPK